LAKTKVIRSLSEIPGCKVLENRDVRGPIREMLQLHGWFVVINWQGQFSHKGVADLVAMRKGETWWIECKKPGGKVSDDQDTFRKEVQGHGCNYMVAESVDDVMPLCRR
jgi:hypothetical protein